MSVWIKALPYIITIGGGLVGVTKWLYGALKEERDYYRQKFLDQESDLNRCKVEISNLKSRLREQQALIKQYQDAEKGARKDIHDDS